MTRSGRALNGLPNQALNKGIPNEREIPLRFLIGVILGDVAKMGAGIWEMCQPEQAGTQSLKSCKSFPPRIDIAGLL